MCRISNKDVQFSGFSWAYEDSYVYSGAIDNRHYVFPKSKCLVMGKGSVQQ